MSRRQISQTCPPPTTLARGGSQSTRHKRCTYTDHRHHLKALAYTRAHPRGCLFCGCRQGVTTGATRTASYRVGPLLREPCRPCLPLAPGAPWSLCRPQSRPVPEGPVVCAQPTAFSELLSLGDAQLGPTVSSHSSTTRLGPFSWVCRSRKGVLLSVTH